MRKIFCECVRACACVRVCEREGESVEAVNERQTHALVVNIRARIIAGAWLFQLCQVQAAGTNKQLPCANCLVSLYLQRGRLTHSSNRPNPLLLPSPSPPLPPSTHLQSAGERAE